MIFYIFFRIKIGLSCPRWSMRIDVVLTLGLTKLEAYNVSYITNNRLLNMDMSMYILGCTFKKLHIICTVYISYFISNRHMKCQQLLEHSWHAFKCPIYIKLRACRQRWAHWWRDKYYDSAVRTQVQCCSI